MSRVARDAPDRRRWTRGRAELERRHGDDGRESVLGFSENMRDLPCAGDAFMTVTAGLSSIEARRCRCRLVGFGFPVGHVRDNSSALARHGLARVTTHAADHAIAALVTCARPSLTPGAQVPAR